MAKQLYSAAYMAAKAGCDVTNSVTNEVTMLVIGTQDKNKYRPLRPRSGQDHGRERGRRFLEDRFQGAFDIGLRRDL